MSDPTHSITTAQHSLSSEQAGRTRKYLISMGIRTVCVIGAIFIPGWPRWVLIAGAVVLPYLAVVIANSGGSRKGKAPIDVPPQPVAALPASGAALEGEVIVPNDNTEDRSAAHENPKTGFHDPTASPHTSRVE